MEKFKAYRCLLIKVAEHLWTGIEECTDHRWIECVLGSEAIEVGDDLLEGILDSVLDLLVIEWDPQHPARHRTRTADHPVLLQNENLASTEIVGREGGRQARPASAEHDNIRLNIEPQIALCHRLSTQSR